MASARPLPDLVIIYQANLVLRPLPASSSIRSFCNSNRRERSFSSITSPKTLASSGVVGGGGQVQHQRSSSAAILDLDYAASTLDSHSKRRALSTCGDHQTTLARLNEVQKAEAIAAPTGLASASSAASEMMVSSWSPPEKLAKFTSKVKLTSTPGTSVASGLGGGHNVRFEDSPAFVAGTKCHHLQLLEGPETSKTWVQRTQSNPEMELCPVCLARKECEILLKRTYSKVRDPTLRTF